VRTRLSFPLMLAAAAIGLATQSARADDKLKVGIIASLSSHASITGGMIRDGFSLAVKQLGGKLGGRETEIVVQDDETKPDVAVSKAKTLIARDRKAGHRRRRLSDQPQCRAVDLGRRRLQSELLLHLLPERSGA
jgi:branched-chain amino acid transport system substrate-binding protein